MTRITRSIRTRARQWQRFAIAPLCMLILLSACALNGASQAETVAALPPIKPFTRARFDLLVTLSEGDAPAQTLEYGSGMLILPDRIKASTAPDVDDPQAYLRNLIQIGERTFLNDATSGGWQRADDAEWMSVQSLLLIDQLVQYASTADGIVRVGEELIDEQPTTQYQLWIPGVEVAQIASHISGISAATRDLIDQATNYKLDLWIDAEGRLRRHNLLANFPENTQNGEIFPATQMAQLVRYYDWDDPSIAIDAPIE